MGKLGRSFLNSRKWLKEFLKFTYADSDMVFRCVRKNTTEFRPTLWDVTLGSLLVEKQNMIATKNKMCYEREYPVDQKGEERN